MDLTSWLLVCFKWQNMEHTVGDSLKLRLVSQAPLVAEVVSWELLVCYLAVSACELCVSSLQKRKLRLKEMKKLFTVTQPILEPSLSTTRPVLFVVGLYS